jgi:hypothetical protein
MKKGCHKKQKIQETKIYGGLGYVESRTDGVLKAHLNMYERNLRWNKINACTAFKSKHFLQGNKVVFLKNRLIASETL